MECPGNYVRSPLEQNKYQQITLRSETQVMKLRVHSEQYWELCQTSKIESSAKIIKAVNHFYKNFDLRCLYISDHQFLLHCKQSFDVKDLENLHE